MKFKLSEIRIRNFLSYMDVTFSEINRFNVLIGKNNSGKSNLLKIMKFLQNNAKTDEFDKSFLYDSKEVLEMHILLQSLKNVVFYDEIEGNGVLSELWKYLNQKLYTRGSPWSCEIILGKIKVLRNLIAHDIIINGSLIWYMNEEIKWELDSPIYVPLEI